jgi:hypothetical protein
MSFIFNEITRQLATNLKNNICLKKVQAKLFGLIKQTANQVRSYSWVDERNRVVQVRSPHSISLLLQKFVLYGKELSAQEQRMLEGLR